MDGRYETWPPRINVIDKQVAMNMHIAIQFKIEVKTYTPQQIPNQ
jgi:hypothetical protein